MADRSVHAGRPVRTDPDATDEGTGATMTEIDAIRHAGAIAVKMGYPWSLHEVRAIRRHFWPFPAHWRVECAVRRHRAIVRIRFRDADGVITYSGVVYPRHSRSHDGSGHRHRAHRHSSRHTESDPAEAPSA